jgi:predicted RNA binding protein YcfA (HicA-like mRNA interferase family)
MSNPRITFAQLRQLLTDLGFTSTVTPKSHVFFAHQPSGAEVAMPVYRSNRIVLPHHLSTIRTMLDAKGLMDGDEFDEVVASAASAKQSAS